MSIDPLDAGRRRDAEKLADILTILQRTFLSNLSKELTRGKVSFPQYLLLGYLSHQESMSMTEVANRMGHTTAASTGLVQRLENLGYLRREHASDDRRKILVEITENGLALVGKIREDMIASLMQLMKHLTAEEQANWVRIYEKIITVFPCV
jgi:DNA-binding MarR family transcriptional regulator